MKEKFPPLFTLQEKFKFRAHMACVVASGLVANSGSGLTQQHVVDTAAEIADEILDFYESIYDEIADELDPTRKDPQ